MTNEERIRKKTKLIYYMKDITGKVLGKVHISEIKERKGNTKDNGEHKSNICQTLYSLKRVKKTY